MPEKISYSDLVKRAQSERLSEAELRRYFVLDANESTPFNPRFRINYDTVDVTGLEAAAATAGHGLAMDASEKPLARRATARGSVLHVAEGDSWFRLPRIYQNAMLYYVARKVPIDNLAHWGDTLEQMISKGEYIPYLKDKKTKVLLFSAGGNDVLGTNLEQCLNLFDARFPDPEHASFYVRRLFFEQLDAVEAQYRQIVTQVAKNSPQTKLFVHGYDYARPIEHGVFLGQHFERRGLYPRPYGELCRAIVRYMIDQFNERLALIAHHYEFVTYIDFRGTLGAGQWFDELHPTNGGAKELADKLLVHLGDALV